MWKKLDVIIIAVLGPERNEFEGEIQKRSNLSHFRPLVSFYTPFENKKTPGFFYVFRVYGKRTLAWWRVTKENIDFLNMLKVNTKDSRLTSIDVFLLFSSLILIRFHLWIKKKIWLINIIVFLIFSDQYSISIPPYISIPFSSKFRYQENQFDSKYFLIFLPQSTCRLSSRFNSNMLVVDTRIWYQLLFRSAYH